MPVNLKGRSFLTLKDFTGEEIRYLLDLSRDLKAKKRAGIVTNGLAGKNIVLLFEKTSTRTRCAFEVAALDEGAHVTYLDQAGSQMNKKESVEDTAKVLGRFYDGIEYRGYGQDVVEKLAKHSGVPVFNGLTDVDHPTQILADMMTAEEYIDKPLGEMKIVFVGDTRNNVSLAWTIACEKMGFTYVGLGPKELWPKNGLFCENVSFTDDPGEIGGADVVYTDVWVSMGEEDKLEERVKLLTPYRLDMKMFDILSGPRGIFMHCLPSYHDFETTTAKKARDEKGLDIREVTDDLFLCPASKVFDEAENRMHTIKAVMTAML